MSARHKKDKKQGIKDSSTIPYSLCSKEKLSQITPFTVIEYTVGMLIFLISLGIYLHTLTPTIGFHDSGDMVTAAYVLGIPHPTGYPLYCLLGKLWMTILPIGNIAYRMNIASALCASSTAMMTYFIMLKISRMIDSPKELCCISFFPAIVSALILSSNHIFWQQAVIAEKYTLNALFAVVIIFILLKLYENVRIYPTIVLRYLYLFAFLLGLSFTHHMQTIFLIIGGCLFIMIIPFKGKNILFAPGSLIKLIGCFAAPLLMYIYLPIRAACHPLLNWGCPNTWNRFISHITASEYQSLFMADNFVSKVKNVFELFMDEFGCFLLLISLIGVLFLLFKNRKILLLFGVIFLLNIILVLQYKIYNPEDYCIISFIIISLLIGQGIEGLMVLVGKIKSSIRFDFLIGIFLLIFSIYLLIIHYPINDRSRYYFAYDYAKSSLNILAKKAIFFAEYKYNPIYFPYWYLLYVEKIRPDITIMNLSLLLSQEWYQKEIKWKYPFFQIPESFNKEDMTAKFDELVKNNINYPLYLSCSNAIDQNVTKNQLLFSDGIFQRVLPDKEDKETILQKLKSESLSYFYMRQIPCNVLHSEKAKIKKMIFNLAQVYSNSGCFYYENSLYNRAEYMITLALRIDPDNPDYYLSRAEVYLENQMYDKAVTDCRRAILIDAKNPFAYNQLGAAYWHKGMLEEAISQFQKAIELNPAHTLPYLNIALIYEKNKNIEKCLEMCKCVLKIDPNNLQAKQTMDRNLRFQK
ncbi:MAG: DUF2723 domain-containing protein [Candidatus Desantisbacteria bacterium]